MQTTTLLRRLAKYFPKRIKSPGDRVGLMTGRLKEKTKKIVLCLDFDDEVMKIIEDLELKDIDLILTHHPYLYGTRYRVLKNDEIKRHLTEKIDRLDIPVYSMHTNFDSGHRGMNDALIGRLDLIEVKQLEEIPMARGGKLKKPMDVYEFAKFAAKQLNAPYGLLTKGGKDIIESVALIGGGGSRYFEQARLEGYDLYISGDAPHHVRRDVLNRKYNYLDLPHEIENIFLERMKEILLEIDETLEVIAIEHEEPPHLIKVF